jgi:capsule polysaccharide export protein KpsE/RkpR
VNTFLRIKWIVILVFLVSGCDLVDNFKKNQSKDNPKKEMSSSSSSAQREDKDIVARVGGWTMTLTEFNQRLDALQQMIPDFDRSDPESKKLVLEELVRQQLIVEEAQNSGLANSQDINDAVEEFRRTVIVREVARLQTQHISVSDGEAMAFYEENRQFLVDPLQLRQSRRDID